MNGNLLQITPHPTRKELGFVVIFVSCHSFFLSVEAFLRKVSEVIPRLCTLFEFFSATIASIG
jgi:hypothetical protein